MTAKVTVLEHTEEGRSFLQQRVARFGLFGSCIGWFFLAFRAVEALARSHLEQLWHPSMAYHAAGAFGLFAIWLLLRSGKRSFDVIHAIEIAGVSLTAAAYSAMAMYISPFGMPHYIVILALSFGLVARAVYVPSTARRTAVVTGLSGIPMLVVTYFIYANVDIDVLHQLVPDETGLTTAALARNAVMFAAAWWLCAVVLCASASQVIYGLRKQMQDVRKLGQYTLVEKLGEGGMGVVYRARHAMLRRPTAVKLLPVAKAGERNVARFEREVQLTAMLTHPNTITIFDYGRTPDGIFYYAMELLEGVHLGDLIELSGPLPASRVVHILDQAAGALAEAHSVGLIHRDIKPANIMLVEQGGKPDVAKVLDFGLVKELERADDLDLTRADTITGTPQYLSPEAIRAPETVDARSDLYALGAVGYFLLTGEHVFTGSTVVEVCSAHLHKEPEAPSARLGGPVPAQLEELILGCLSKEPERRPESAERLREVLFHCRQVDAWDDAQGREWWDEHRTTIAARRETRVGSGTGLSIAIDMARRVRVA